MQQQIVRSTHIQAVTLVSTFAVMNHGFGSAWGFFVCCLKPLAKQFNVIAIDWVGSGRLMFGLAFACRIYICTLVFISIQIYTWIRVVSGQYHS